MASSTVTGVAELDARLGRGEVVVLDGGMGTELEARGAPMDREAWSAIANLEHEELVKAAHADFLDAGADLVIANTFPAGLFALEAAGVGDRFEEANRRAVEAAHAARRRAAADRPVAVAGSMSPMLGGAVIQRSAPSAAALREAYRRQAAVLAAAGADLIVTEMIQSAQWHGVVVEAALETGLPVWLGVSAGPKDAQGRLGTIDVPDVTFEEVVAGLVDLPVSAVAVMHTELGTVDGALDVVERRWQGPTAVYPHHGEYRPPSWTFHELDPDDLATRARRWVDRGVRLVGGCCGVRPPHIRALRDGLTG